MFKNTVTVEINNEKETFCREVWEEITRAYGVEFPADLDSAAYWGISDLSGVWSDVVPVQVNGKSYAIDLYVIPPIINAEYYEPEKKHKVILEYNDNGARGCIEFNNFDNAFRAMMEKQDKTLYELGVIIPYIRKKNFDRITCSNDDEIQTRSGSWVKVSLKMYSATIDANNYKQELKIVEV